MAVKKPQARMINPAALEKLLATSKPLKAPEKSTALPVMQALS